MKKVFGRIMVKNTQRLTLFSNKIINPSLKLSVCQIAITFCLLSLQKALVQIRSDILLN